MKIFINILVTLIYWILTLLFIKKIKLNLIIKSILLILDFIGYVLLYYNFYDGYFNIYNYIIIIFTFLYIYLYK